MTDTQIQTTAGTQIPVTLSFPDGSFTDGPTGAQNGAPAAGPGLSEDRLAELWLVQRAQRGEPGAMEEILSEHRGPAVHRVASLAKRWLLGTHQGSVDDAHLVS